MGFLIKNSDKLTAFILLMSFMVFLLPIVNSTGDEWDGSIISYAASIQNFDGIKNWFFESGWPLQYFQIIIFNAVSIFLNVDYATVNSVAVIVLMILCSFEVYLFSTNKLKYPRCISHMTVAMFLVFPAWFVLSSNVMLYHFLCLTCALIGLRIFRRSGILLNIIGILLIAFSYTLSSLVMFIPALSLLGDSLDSSSPYKNTNKKIFPYTSVTYKTAFISILAVFIFLCNKVFYPSHGLYEGYNRIVDITSSNGLHVYIDNLIKYTSFLTLILSLSLLFLVALFIKNKTVLPTLSFIAKRKSLFALIIFAVFPYTAVGKSTSILDGSFDARQSILLALPIAILTAELYIHFSKELSRNKVLSWHWAANIFIMCITLTFACISIKKTIDLKERGDIKDGIVAALKTVSKPIKPCLVNIVLNKYPKDHFRSYEANYMMYLAFNKAVWFAKVGGWGDFSFINLISKNKEYQVKYIYTPSDDCVNKTVIDVNLSIGNKGIYIPKINSSVALPMNSDEANQLR